MLRLRSPSAESTGVSPAAKRTYRSVSTARKELFPTVDPNPTDVTASVTLIACEHNSASIAQVPAPLPQVRMPPHLLTSSPVSHIPVANAIPHNDEQQLIPEQRTYYQYARYSSSCFSKLLQDKTSAERQHLENQHFP